MKLLIITSLKEYMPHLSALLEQAGITVYSVTRTTGVRTTDGASLIESWFGSKSGDFDSIFAFTFTEGPVAAEAVSLVDRYNMENDTGFPLRAFVLPVENASQFISKT